MHVVGYRRLGDLETPGEVRGSRGRTCQNRCDGVPCRVTERPENRLGVYRWMRYRPCGMMLGWNVVKRPILLHNSVGRTRVCSDWQVESNPLCIRLVFRPPSPRIEGGRDHVAAIDETVTDGRSNPGADLPRVVIESDRKIQLATEIAYRSLFTNVPHAKRFGAQTRLERGPVALESGLPEFLQHQRQLVAERLRLRKQHGNRARRRRDFVVRPEPEVPEQLATWQLVIGQDLTRTFLAGDERVNHVSVVEDSRQNVPL